MVRAGKRIILVHGWEGRADNHWFPWIRREAERRGVTVYTPPLPNPAHPVLAEWISALRETIAQPNFDTIFIGHSLGCVTIAHYLASLPEGARVGGAVFVAGFLHSLGIQEIENFTTAPFDRGHVREVCPQIAALQSTNDEYVPLSEGDALRRELGARVHQVADAGHFCADDGYTTFPLLKKIVFEMAVLD